VAVAKTYLSGLRPSAKTRNEVQELVWALFPSLEVPVRFRREVAKALEGEPLWLKPNALMDLLESLFILENPLDFFSSSLRNLKWKIQQWPARHAASVNPMNALRAE
jgi:hypothetical protein